MLPNSITDFNEFIRFLEPKEDPLTAENLEAWGKTSSPDLNPFPFEDDDPASFKNIFFGFLGSSVDISLNLDLSIPFRSAVSKEQSIGLRSRKSHSIGQDQAI